MDKKEKEKFIHLREKVISSTNPLSTFISLNLESKVFIINTLDKYNLISKTWRTYYIIIDVLLSSELALYLHNPLLYNILFNTKKD